MPKTPLCASDLLNILQKCQFRAFAICRCGLVLTWKHLYFYKKAFSVCAYHAVFVLDDKLQIVDSRIYFIRTNFTKHLLFLLRRPYMSRCQQLLSFNCSIFPKVCRHMKISVPQNCCFTNCLLSLFSLNCVNSSGYPAFNFFVDFYHFFRWCWSRWPQSQVFCQSSASLVQDLVQVSHVHLQQTLCFFMDLTFSACSHDSDWPSPNKLLPQS